MKIEISQSYLHHSPRTDYYAQWHVWRSTRGETLIYKDQGLDPSREYENASNKQDKDVVFLNHPCRWWPQGTMLGASPSPITGHHDHPGGKLDFPKRRMRSVLQQVRCKPRSDSIFGSTRRFVGACSPMCLPRLHAGALAIMLRGCTSPSCKATVYNSRQTSEFNPEPQANQHGRLPIEALCMAICSNMG